MKKQQKSAVCSNITVVSKFTSLRYTVINLSHSCVPGPSTDVYNNPTARIVHWSTNGRIFAHVLFSSPFLVLSNSPRHPAVHSRRPCSAHKLWSVNQCQAASADVLSALQPRQHLQSCTQQAAAVLTAKGRNTATTY